MFYVYKVRLDTALLIRHHQCFPHIDFTTRKRQTEKRGQANANAQCIAYKKLFRVYWPLCCRKLALNSHHLNFKTHPIQTELIY